MYNIFIKTFTLFCILMQIGGIDMKTRWIALLTSSLMLATAAGVLPAQAADKPAEDPLFGTLPDWVPTDFVEALDFYNTYGKTHVEDNIICLVRPMIDFRTDDYNVEISGTMTQINTPAGSIPHIYALEIPEKPDPDDEEAMAAYKAYCEKLGIYDYDYSFFTSYEGRKTKGVYEVCLYRVLEGYDLNIAWTMKDDGKEKTTEKFSFENKDGTTVETDMYAWLPDSEPEFDYFLDTYSNRAAVVGNAAQGVYVAYAASVNASTGASLKMEQSGEGELKEAFTSSCNRVELIPLDGGGNNYMILYAPTADGMVDVTWTLGREWSDEDPFELVERRYEISDNCTMITPINRIDGPQTTITLRDADTGDVIELTNVCYIQEKVPGQPYAGDLYYMRTNPCSFKKEDMDAFDPTLSYYVQLGSDAGWYVDPQFEITSQKGDVTEITGTLRWRASGDADGSGSFGLTDIILLQKHLLGLQKADITNPDSVDFFRDNVIDVFDLGMMKRLLFENKKSGYVEPDVPVRYGTPMYVIADGLELHAGPDDATDVLAVIPEYASLSELGYMKGNDIWVYTQYQGIFGWIRIMDDEGKTVVDFEKAADKPVIYLYPEEETDVHVELDLTGMDLSTTYPRYNNGWDVTASPDGSLLNKADGTHHRYLFWDAVNCRTRYDLSKGFCVAGADTEAFLKEKLTYMGLTEDEMNEFLVYWLPRMEHNAFNLITFQGEAYTNAAKLSITPAPDSLCRIFMVYKPLESAVEIEPQELPTFERKGFAVVEWGGSELG